jgi:hypothetical protein
MQSYNTEKNMWRYESANTAISALETAKTLTHLMYPSDQ